LVWAIAVIAPASRQVIGKFGFINHASFAQNQGGDNPVAARIAIVPNFDDMPPAIAMDRLWYIASLTMKPCLHLTFAAGGDWRPVRIGIQVADFSVVCLFLLTAGFGAGCKKTDAAANPPMASAEQAAPPSPRGPGTPASMPATPVVIAAAADSKTTLDQLTLELRKYVVRTRSVPKDFEDFIARSQVQAPTAPDGKKYAIQNHAVVLVNR